AQVDATPEKDGVKEHYVCEGCGKLFADEACTVEVTAEDLVIKYVAPTEVVEPTTVEPTTVEPTTAPAVTPTDAATKDSATKDSSTKDSTTKDSTTAKTGDSTHTYLWLLIMLASMAGAAGVLYTAKRKGIFNK
ncbi:MAG: LPXTG cell wall anchor domain-containing protein, partial [Ruminococcus sp.]|nr:LPXTG cell wall anchor domain-containing protein [Ruminococcus sp.]